MIPDFCIEFPSRFDDMEWRESKLNPSRPQCIESNMKRKLSAKQWNEVTAAIVRPIELSFR